ncbi:terminase small subunit [Caedibacter taeniospiralis]|uniref:terminase small subunit n=1 Tax=Caedibacter taeniospiralis TaxID=28907 RepID=UPI000C2788A6|nr:terminase small subunit [Caedibacter taeniospiralis]
MAANLITARVLAKLLKLSERRVQQLVKEGVLTKEKNGQYPMIENIHRYIDYIGVRARNNDSDIDLNVALKEEKLRLIKAQADNQEIKAKLAAKQVIEVSRIEMVLGAVFTLMRERLLNIPDRSERTLVGETDKDIFKKTLTHEITDSMYSIEDGIDEVFDKLINGDSND